MKKFILAGIRFYQRSYWFRSSFLKAIFATDAVCRFSPTCSTYTYQAVAKYGSMKGLWLGLKRIVRCHPWAHAGYDPIPE